MGLARKSRDFFKLYQQDGLIYPNYFAPIIIRQNNARIIKLMRYRVRPQNSVAEIPSKYNVYNARVEALEERNLWRRLYLKKHALIPFLNFYEWVKVTGQAKKQLVNFYSVKHPWLWAPALYDVYSTTDGKLSFGSFALITKAAPKEIAQLGHNRCPILFKKELIDLWLDTTNLTKAKSQQILHCSEQVEYSNRQVHRD